jgi:hypothetical protein
MDQGLNQLTASVFIDTMQDEGQQSKVAFSVESVVDVQDSLVLSQGQEVFRGHLT